MPKQFRDYVEAHYPNYFVSDEILEMDILTRYFNNEELTQTDIERIKSIWGVKKLAKYRQGLTESIALKTIKAMK